MSYPYFAVATLDDLMHEVVGEVMKDGQRIGPRRGGARELTGVLLELTNPLARLSRTETRGKPFSCLGELCWYLSAADDLGSIAYYLGDYRDEAEEGVLWGAYGPRLFNRHGHDQVRTVIDLLGQRQDSRQAVIQIFDAEDIAAAHKDVPCTCTLQFLSRGGRLNMVTTMRSNDVFRGLPHDVFCFTMLQELIARSLSLAVGTYKHVVGSLHVYERDEEACRQFLEEGYQSTDSIMPEMPVGDPWASIRSVLDAEAAIRSGRIEDKQADEVELYWGDLIRLLQVFGHSKARSTDGIARIRGRMSSSAFDLYISQRLPAAR